MPETLRILPFSPAHAADVARLNKEWLTQYFFVEPEDEKTLGDPQKYIIDEGGHIIMAELDGKIVGTCSLLHHGDWWELAKMAVTASAQGRGLGRKLGEAVIELARKQGLKTLWIVTNTRLETALRLYYSFGFMPSAVNRHHRYKRGDITLEMPL